MYTSDKYVITDTRGLYPRPGAKRNESQRAYMEKHQEGKGVREEGRKERKEGEGRGKGFVFYSFPTGYNIVLVVFNSSDLDTLDKKIISVYKKIYPEIAGIMHVVLTQYAPPSLSPFFKINTVC